MYACMHVYSSYCYSSTSTSTSFQMSCTNIILPMLIFIFFLLPFQHQHQLPHELHTYCTVHVHIMHTSQPAHQQVTNQAAPQPYWLPGDLAAGGDLVAGFFIKNKGSASLSAVCVQAPCTHTILSMLICIFFLLLF